MWVRCDQLKASQISFHQQITTILQGIQSFAGRSDPQSFTATVWFGSNKLGNISVILDTSNRLSESATVQIFAAGGALNGELAAVAVEAGYQAHFLLKTVDSSGFTFMEGGLLDHRNEMAIFCLIICML